MTTINSSQAFYPALLQRNVVPVRPQIVDQFLYDGEVLTAEPVPPTSATADNVRQPFEFNSSAYDFLQRRGRPEPPAGSQRQLEAYRGEEEAIKPGYLLDEFA